MLTTKYQVEILKDNQVHQGDIFKSVSYYDDYKESRGNFELTLFKFPYAIVLTQECDLNSNSKERLNINNETEIIKHDKYLVSLLCAPLYNAEHLFSGNHLSKLNIETENKDSVQKKYIKSNRDPRYHYIEFEDQVGIVPLVIDFKHYFTVSLINLENNIANNRVCSLKPIFRESVTQRFSNFLSRIGLPDPII